MSELYDKTLPRWLNYCKAMIETNDLDPVYNGLAGAIANNSISTVDFSNFLVSFSLLYSMEESCKIVHQSIRPDQFWDYLIENYPNMKRGKARRYFRGEQGMTCLLYLKDNYRNPSEFISAMYDPDYANVVKNFSSVPAFGNYHTWKWLDFFERVINMECNITLDYACKVLPSEPVKGAKLVSEEVWPGEEFDLKRTLSYMISECNKIGLMAPPYKDRPINVQEIETCLCGIVHMYKGLQNDYIGKDLKEKYHEVYNVGESAKWLICHMPEPLPHGTSFNDPVFKSHSNNSFSLLDL